MDNLKQVSTVASVALPVDERLMVRRCRYKGGEGARRLCIVTGTHGDELEGQYVCFALAQRIQQSPECLNGIVDIYPALNPMGIDSVTRGIPAFDLDMNRIFPGSKSGSAFEEIASDIVESLTGAELVLDIHASSIFLREVLQGRIMHECEERLMPLARRLNLEFIWSYPAATVMKATLSHTLNSLGTPCIVVEMDVGMRINKRMGDRLVDGILALLVDLGIWKGEAPRVGEPIVSTKDEGVVFVNAGGRPASSCPEDLQGQSRRPRPGAWAVPRPAARNGLVGRAGPLRCAGGSACAPTRWSIRARSSPG